jgi:hypothetical protein
VGDVDLDDARAAGEDQRLRELLLADRAQHRLDSAAAVRVERAAEVVDVDVREAAEHAVDQPARQRAPPRVMTAQAPAARDVGAALDCGHELGNVLRRVLEVSVHRHDDVAACTGHARVHRGMLAEVALEADDTDARVVLVELVELREGAVAGTVVDEDQLEADRGALERVDRAPVKLVHRLGLVEDRNDDGDVGNGLGQRRSRGRRDDVDLGHFASQPTLGRRGVSFPSRRCDRRSSRLARWDLSRNCDGRRA